MNENFWEQAPLVDQPANKPAKNFWDDAPIAPSEVSAVATPSKYVNRWPETSYLRSPEPNYTKGLVDGQEVILSPDGKSHALARWNATSGMFDTDVEDPNTPVAPPVQPGLGMGASMPIMMPPKRQTVSISPDKVVGFAEAADKVATAKTAFARSIIPTAGGFGGFAGGAAIGAALAPETGGLSLLIPLLAGGVGGFAGGAGASAIQDKYLPLSPEQQLNLESNPNTAGIASFAPALLAAPTSPKTYAQLFSKEAGVAANAATKIGGNAVMMSGMGTGNDVAANALAGRPLLEGVDINSVTKHGLSGLLLGEPNKLGRAMEAPGRIAANAYLKTFPEATSASSPAQPPPLPIRFEDLGIDPTVSTRPSDADVAAAIAQAQAEAAAATRQRAGQAPAPETAPAAVESQPAPQLEVQARPQTVTPDNSDAAYNARAAEWAERVRRQREAAAQPVAVQPEPVAPVAEAPAPVAQPTPVAEVAPAQPAPVAAQPALPAAEVIPPRPERPDINLVTAADYWKWVDADRAWFAKYGKTAPAPVAAKPEPTPAPAPQPVATAQPAAQPVAPVAQSVEVQPTLTRENPIASEARARLAKLEAAGKGDSDQAKALRRTIERNTKPAEPTPVAQVEAPAQVTEPNPRKNAEISPQQSPQAEAVPIAERAPVKAASVTPASTEGAAVRSTDNITIQRIPTPEIKADPKLMQYKATDDVEAGVNKNDKLSGKWDETKAGVVTVWQPSNPSAYGLKPGEKYIVANGHHRLDFANRAGRPDMNVHVLKEADGWTAADARMQAAEINIADGKGSPQDAVKYLQAIRERDGQAAFEAAAKRVGSNEGSRRNVEIAKGLKGEALDLFINQKIDPRQAEAIAMHSPDDVAVQNAGAKSAVKGLKPETVIDVMNTVKAVRDEALKAKDESQSTMFKDMGMDDGKVLEIAEKLAIKAAERRSAIDDKLRAVQGASKRPEKAGAGGVKVENVEKTKQYIADLKGQREELANWRNNPELKDSIYKDAGVTRAEESAAWGKPPEAETTAPAQAEIPGTAETFNLAAEKAQAPKEFADMTPDEQAAYKRVSDTSTGDMFGDSGTATKGGLLAAMAAISPATAEAATRAGRAAAEGVSNMDLLTAAAAIGFSASDRPLSSLNPIAANMHLLARDTRSSAISDVANMFNRLGGNRPEGAKETFYEERDSSRRIFRSRLAKAFEPLAKFSDEQLRQMDQTIAMGVSGEAKLNGPMAETVKRLKAFSDEIFAYLKEAGVEVNHVDDYGMPHSFNSEKVAKDEQGFLASARQAYQLNNPLRIKRLEGYVSRLEAQAGPNGLTVEQTATRDKWVSEIDKLTQAKPNDQAQDLLDGIGNSNSGGDSTQGLLLEPSGTGQNKADFTRERIFEPSARRLLREYFDNDPRHAWNTYINRATTLAEFARRFGADGSKWNTMVSKMRSENVSEKDVTRIKHMVLDSLGALNHAPTDGHALAISVLGMSNMAKLKSTALANFLESQSQAIPGNVTDAVTAPVHMMGQFIAHVSELSPRMQARIKDAIGVELSSETGSMELARIVGLLDAAGIHEIMENSASSIERQSDYTGVSKSDKAARTVSKVTGSMSRTFGIEATENAKRSTAAQYAVSRLDGHVSESLRDGMLSRAYEEATGVSNNPFTLKNEARARLRRAGIPDAKQAEFGKWWEAARAKDINEALQDGSPMAKMAAKAIRMETARSSVNTNRAMRPGGVENPLISQDNFFGKLVMTFLNYPATFKEQIGKPMMRDIATGVKGYESEAGQATFYSSHERARMIARAAAIPAMAVSSATYLALRAWATGHGDEVDRKPWWKLLLEGLSYTGFMGGKAELASRVSRDQLPPIIDESTRLLRDINREDDKKNGKERAVARGVIRSVGQPVGIGAASTLLPMPLAAVVSQALASTTFREMATDFVAGESKTKPKK